MFDPCGVIKPPPKLFCCPCEPNEPCGEVLLVDGFGVDTDCVGGVGSSNKLARGWCTGALEGGLFPPVRESNNELPEELLPNIFPPDCCPNELELADGFPNGSPLNPPIPCCIEPSPNEL